MNDSMNHNEVILNNTDMTFKTESNNQDIIHDYNKRRRKTYTIQGLSKDLEFKITKSI